MAQASITANPMASGPPGPSGLALRGPAFTPDELREIQEYDRIVQFRDSILAGHHPRIKVPVQAAAKSQSSSQPIEPGAASFDRHLDNLQAFGANSQHPTAADSAAGSSTMSESVSKSFGSGATQINPLLLTKSDELIRAETRMQRQRLEKSLKEQYEQHRSARRAEAQLSEQASALDIADILAKALTLVQATAPSPANGNTVANASDSSDSFDDKTFYSSQHDTPEPHISPPAHSTSAYV
jgi:hypothetical protein